VPRNPSSHNPKVMRSCALVVAVEALIPVVPFRLPRLPTLVPRIRQTQRLI
jgi:hypothetical protein